MGFVAATKSLILRVVEQVLGILFVLFGCELFQSLVGLTWYQNDMSFEFIFFPMVITFVLLIAFLKVRKMRTGMEGYYKAVSWISLLLFSGSAGSAVSVYNNRALSRFIDTRVLAAFFVVVMAACLFNFFKIYKAKKALQ